MDTTLAGLRDAIIRNLGYPTAGDVLKRQAQLAGRDPDPIALAKVKGQAPPNIGWLTPELMNQKIEEAVSEINLRTLDFGNSQPLTVQVPAQSTNGPAYVQLSQGFNTANSQIDRMQSVRWLTDGNTSYDPIQLTNLQELDRNGYDWRGAVPSTPPIYLAISAYELWVIPGPATSGTLSILAVLGLIFPKSDTETLQQLPVDLYPQFMYKATALVAGTQQNDPVMRTFYQTYFPMGEKAVKIIAETMSGMNDQYQSSVTPDIGRIQRQRR